MPPQRTAASVGVANNNGKVFEMMVAPRDEKRVRFNVERPARQGAEYFNAAAAAAACETFETLSPGSVAGVYFEDGE